MFGSIRVTKAEILACSFSQWCEKFPEFIDKYKIFRPLPDSFIKYLNSDGIQLTGLKLDISPNSDNEYSEWENDDPDQSLVSIAESFLELHGQIGEAIDSLGGSVSPKLNWSAPKDARWILPGNCTKCTCPDDVYLLLNASDHIMDDLEAPFTAVDFEPGFNDSDIHFKSEIENENAHEIITVDNGLDAVSIESNKNPTKSMIETENIDTLVYELVLRQWRDINPALEFRIFIRHCSILGISQRDPNHYTFLRGLRYKLDQTIRTFINDIFIPRFPQKCIVDVYVPAPYNKVVIVDINAFTRKSHPHLFTWHELLTESSNGDIRLVEKMDPTRFAAKEFSESSVPMEMLNQSLNADGMVQMIKELSRLQKD